ncbi:hypothetical protein C1H46_005672 [Malus baccata]|uniref:Uncharacterized protein n=1 Tax=Malus baccata TaxID=106549 RepID=A0A540NCC3_MALBA|nr:hypothetical protein C1H46_005672 [Malus baccata]
MEDKGWSEVLVRTWVSRADLVSKWCLGANGGSRSGSVGKKSDVEILANVSNSKGKNVKEVMDLEAGDKFSWK